MLQPGSSTNRSQCDIALLTHLQTACTAAYFGRSVVTLQSCYAVAVVYYVGVRLFGRSHYDGTGNPA